MNITPAPEASGVRLLTTDNAMPFKFGVATYSYIQTLIEMFAGEDHGISVGTETYAGETWIELHCPVPVTLRKGLRRVFYPSIYGDRNTRRAHKRDQRGLGRTNRSNAYAVIFLPGESLARGDVPLAVPTIGALVDLLIERRALRDAAVKAEAPVAHT